MKEGKLAQLEQKIFDAYKRRTTKSKQLYDRAGKSLQVGVYSVAIA